MKKTLSPCCEDGEHEGCNGGYRDPRTFSLKWCGCDCHKKKNTEAQTETLQRILGVWRGLLDLPNP